MEGDPLPGDQAKVGEAGGQFIQSKAGVCYAIDSTRSLALAVAAGDALVHGQNEVIELGSQRCRYRCLRKIRQPSTTINPSAYLRFENIWCPIGLDLFPY